MNKLIKISKSIPNFLRDALNSESDLDKKNKGYDAAIQRYILYGSSDVLPRRIK